jgi:hypothetical protein
MIATTRPGDGEPLSRSEFVSAPKDVLARIASELEQY